MTSSKNLYEFLNQMEIDLEAYPREELTEIEKSQLLRHFKKSRKKTGLPLKKMGAIAAGVVITLGIFGQTGAGKTVYGAAQSKVSEISYSISKSLGIDRDIQPYTNVINQIVEDQGVEIKLTDVIIDQDELIFSAIIHANRTMAGFDFDYDVRINGKRLNSYSRTGVAGEIETDVYFESYVINVKDLDTSKDLDIRLTLKNLSYYEDFSVENPVRKKVNGKWEFAFLANGAELAKNTQMIPLDHTFYIEEQAYRLQELRLNPVNQKITGIKEGAAGGAYQIELRGYDNLGNEITFYLATSSKTEFVFRYENISHELAEDITSITLTPYADQLPEENGRLNNDYKQVGDPFTIWLK